jgi:4-hydroxybenzoate polyprenyltransferase
MVALLMAGVVAICAALPPRFALVLGLYVTLSVSYTLWLKRKMLVDVFVLAGLYTLRLLAGGEATAVDISRWLLAFSIFFFVSLAFAKRYSELHLLAAEGRTKAKGRNYTLDDLRIIEGTGPASGYLAVMVLALYINDASGTAASLYRQPFFLWMLCPLLMYWITRVWFLAGRQMLDDDPILFAIKDRISWWTMLTAVAFVVAAWQPWLPAL